MIKAIREFLTRNGSQFELLALEPTVVLRRHIQDQFAQLDHLSAALLKVAHSAAWKNSLE